MKLKLRKIGLIGGVQRNYHGVRPWRWSVTIKFNSHPITLSAFEGLIVDHLVADPGYRSIPRLGCPLIIMQAA